ncbi:MAG: hypothetical protein II825_00730 [Paludibacteraceae bacterium]|nr:hypothetical protein [Paludibacteraceae bacterium]
MKNNFTTPEQSKRLLELGVPADSADCSIDEWGRVHKIPQDNGNLLFSQLKRQTIYTIRPCWSVGQLIDILSNSQGWKPKCVSIPESAINAQIDFLIKCIETKVFLNIFYYWEDKPKTLHEIAELVCERKLRGFFILRNGNRIHSNELRRADKNSPITTHMYWLRTNKDDLYNMYDYDLENVYGSYNSLDVVDFSKLDE